MSFKDYTILEPELLNPETGTAKGYRVFHQVRSRNRRSSNQQIRQWFRDHPEGMLLVKFDHGTWFQSNYRSDSREEILGLECTYRFLVPDTANPKDYKPVFYNGCRDESLYFVNLGKYTWSFSGPSEFGSGGVSEEKVIHKQGNEVRPIFGPQQGEQTMMSNANYSIAVLKKQLLVAKDKHVRAIKDTTKAGASELDELMKRFKDTGTATCTEEPIMLPTSPVTAAAYDEALSFLDLLAGDTVESTALPFNPVNLLRNAGEFDTGKRFVEVRTFV